MGIKDYHGRLGRQTMLFQEYNFTIKYLPGKENGAADAASRLFDKDNSVLAISVYGQRESHEEAEILNLKNLDPY